MYSDVPKHKKTEVRQLSTR